MAVAAADIVLQRVEHETSEITSLINSKSAGQY